MKANRRHKTPHPEISPPLSPLPPAPQPLEGVWKWALPLLLCLYLILASVHAAWAPTGQTGYQNAPDEAAHVTYIRVIRSGHLPTRADPQPGATEPRSPYDYEWHQPPLYYLIASPLLSLGEKAVRFASILCGVAGILLIFRFARLLFPQDPKTAVLAAGIAALIPGHIAITSTVNNDALLDVCFSGTLLVLAASLKSGWTTGRAIWLGVALGAALLTKATSLLLIPLIGFAMLLLWRGGAGPGKLMKGLAWTVSVTLLLSGWWLVRNYLIYHELLPLQAFQQSFSGTAQASDFVNRVGWGEYLRIVAQMTFQSFWAVYGNEYSAVKLHGWPLFLPDQVYWCLGAVTAAVSVGMVRLHLQSKTLFSDSQRQTLWVLFGTLLLVAGSFSAFLMHYFQTQGRYLYPAMLPIAMIFALGLRAFLKLFFTWIQGLGLRSIEPQRYVDIGSGMFLLLLALLSVAFLSYISPI